jgi:YVTN family beta-propeller protein
MRQMSRAATRALTTLLAAAGAAPTAAAAAEPTYRAVKQIPIGGGSGWDYLYAEPEAHRLYVSHGTKVVVIDTDKDKVVGEILDTPGVHGFVPVPALGQGFSTNGQENKASVVDLATLKTVTKVPTGGNPDALLYEPKGGLVWTFNGRGRSATSFDAKTAKVVGEDVPLDGKPETGVADPSGERLYVNLEDKNEVAVVDVKTRKVTARWPIAPGTAATGMAIDPATHRLIVGCGNSKMVMLDATTGAVVATADAGQGIDAVAFDPETHLAFASAGGSGTVTIARVEADKLTVVQTLTTERGARTMTVDPKTHKIYLSNAKSRTDANSFKVLVYGPEGAAPATPKP